MGVAFAQTAAAPRPPVKDTRSADPTLVRSGDYMSEPNHTRIVWAVKHNGFSTFMAVFPKFDAKLKLDAADPTKSSVEVSVPIDAVTSGVPAPEFTDTLKSDKYFNAAKFPTATFKSTSVTRLAPNKAAVNGELTFLGVTKPATLMATFNQSGEGPAPGYKVGFDGTMTFKRSEWGMMTSLPGVSDEVNLMIEAEFVPAK
jgi:polyisoprenoid-binding protein YceI